LVSSYDLNSDSSDDDDDVDFDDDGDDSFLVGVGDMDVEEAILSGHHKIQFDDENENVEVSEAIIAVVKEAMVEVVVVKEAMGEVVKEAVMVVKKVLKNN
jgi:hypothetical protein